MNMFELVVCLCHMTIVALELFYVVCNHVFHVKYRGPFVVQKLSI